MKAQSHFMTILCFSTLILFYSSLLYAEEEEGGGSHTGADKAVTQYDPHTGFQLSDLALKTLQIQYQILDGKDSFQVSLNALVYFKDEVGVYRVQKDRFKLIEVKVLSKTNAHAKIQSPELRPKDKIVIEGAPLLRVAELDAAGGSGGHDD